MEETRVLPFINPALGETFGEVRMASPEEARRILDEMRGAFPIWSQKSVQERVRVLRKFQKVLIDSLDEVTAVMTQDTGKSRQDALIEVYMTVDMLQHYLIRAPLWLKRRTIPTWQYFMKRAYVEQRPYGVVAIIAPWNYPLALLLPAALGALLAGNTVVVKPSEVTAATGVMLEQVFQRVPELSPFIRFLHGDGAVGAAMVQAGPDYIFLTGSTATGKKVMQAAAERLIPVACELGGKDAMIVLEDADLESAAKWGVWGAFYNTGQACMSVERVYVVEAAYEEFVRLAVEHTQRLKVGYTIDQKSPYYMGPMTDPRQVKIIERHLQDAQEKGARILTGGGKNEMFFEPAVLVDVDHSMLLMQEETFGPFMPIVKVRDEEEAIRLANDCSLGLGASVWSGDLERAHRVAHRIEASSVVINDTIAQFAIPLLPFGGIKQSGYGRTHGKEGLMQFTRPYAYLYGQPPASWDLTVVARKPGNYRLMAGLTRLMFGVGAQRLQPVAELLEEAAKPLQPKSPVLGLSAALAAGAALSGIVLASKRRRAKQ